MIERQKILLVDDKKENLFALETILKGVDAQPICALSGNEALIAVLNHDFALAILDVQMPGMDGYELAALIRKNEKTKDLPIIFVSAIHRDDVHVFKGYEFGAVDFLSKPFEPRILLGKIQIFLRLDALRQVAARKNEELEALVADRTAGLSHLNRVYLSLRCVNQLIVREKDPGLLIKKACLCLTGSGGYKGAWVALLDAQGRLKSAAQAGIGDAFADLVAQMERGELPRCARDALARRETVVVEDIAGQCTDCALCRVGANNAALTHQIAHEGRVYGLITVSFPTIFDHAGEEAHFAELADDLGLALASMERRAAHRRAEQVLEAMFENARDGIILADGPTQRFVKLNPAMREMLGYHSDEVAGLSVADIHPPEGVPLAHETVEKQLRGQDREGTDVPMKRKDGSTFLADVTAAPVMIGDRPHLMGIFRDVTERKKQELQLFRAQRMESVGRLAGGVAHDFNNLLTVILSSCEFLSEKLAEGDPAVKDVDLIRGAGTRAALLTRQLLAFSRRQPMAPVVLDLNGVLEEMKKLLSRLLGENIRLAFFPCPDLWPVKADPGQLEQIIVNLAVNARDAMPDGGQLTFETANVDVDEEYSQRHVAVSPGPYVMLTVSDSGTGMDADTREHAFEPFFTTKKMGKGTGLGLATIYGIVKAHHGNIWIYSEPKKGTTFKIYLPRSESPLSVKEEASSAPALPSRGNETVLVVEDQDTIRQAVLRILKRSDYRMLEARDGEEATALARDFDGPIHLLLTDVMMPGISGPETAGLILATQPEMRVLYMSGFSANAIVLNGVLPRGTSFIEKPFTMNALMGKIREVLDEP